METDKLQLGLRLARVEAAEREREASDRQEKQLEAIMKALLERPDKISRCLTLVEGDFLLLEAAEEDRVGGWGERGRRGGG